MRFKSSIGLILALVIIPGIRLAYGEDTSTQDRRKITTDDSPIRLESVFVGDKEQPAISYFIPWQGIGAPDNLYWSMEKNHDDELSAVHREVMLRSIQIYEDMNLQSP